MKKGPAQDQTPPGAKKIFDVCIIGAGWSGLLACKYAKENGLDPVVLESRSGLGGVWNFSTDPDVSTVMDSTITSSSTTVTEASDFPIDHRLGNFVHRSGIQRYLEDYAKHFELYDHIRFGEPVVAVERTPQHWTVHCEGKTYYSRYVVVCSGVNQQENLDVAEVGGFGGETTHISKIKSIPPDAYGAGDHVLVYGGGESAGDVVELLTDTRARVTWAIPGGQHFFRKARIFDRLAPGKYDSHDRALDEGSSRFIQLISPPDKSKPGYRWICNLWSTGSALSYEGHGIPEWRKNLPFFHAMINKNGHVIEFVRAGRVTAKGKISHSEGHSVTFEDGTSDDFTHLILCSGYEYGYPFLPAEYASRRAQDHYRLIFNPNDPSLLLIGFARPTILSIPFMTELQCMYAFKVLSGKIALPNEVAMHQGIKRDNGYRDAHFSSVRRDGNLVNPFKYGYDVSKLSGAYPDYGRLFLKSPSAFFKTYFSPLSAAHFLLNDDSKRREAVDQIWSRQHLDFFIFPFVILVARLLLVDRFLRVLMDLKYRRQLRKKRRSRVEGNVRQSQKTPAVGPAAHLDPGSLPSEPFRRPPESVTAGER